jgi:hypothetical protein
MKNGKSRSKWIKSKGYSLTFLLFFCLFMKKGKSRSKWTKSKGCSLTFLPIYEKWKKSLKMDEKKRV